MNAMVHLSNEQLSGLLDSALEPAEELAARAHLASCDSCTGKLEALTRLGIALQAEAIPPAPPVLRARIRQQLHARRGIPRWSLGVAAVIVAGVMIAVLFRDQRLPPATEVGTSEAVPNSIDEETEEHKDALRSLGYVGNAPVSDEPYPSERPQPRKEQRDQKLSAPSAAAKAESPAASGTAPPPRADAQAVIAESNVEQDSRENSAAPLAAAPSAPPASEKRQRADARSHADETVPTDCVEFKPELTVRDEVAGGSAFIDHFWRVTGVRPRVESTTDEGDLVLSVPRQAWEQYRVSTGEASLPVTPERAACVRFRLATAPRH